MKKNNKNNDTKSRGVNSQEVTENAYDDQKKAANYNRSKSKSRKTDTKKGAIPDMNDYRWYMPNDFIASNFDYALEGILGNKTNLSGTVDVSDVIPTIMSISFFNTPGQTSRDIMGFMNPKSASINIAARVLFTELSSENKKTTNYQPQDIALAIIAETQLIAAMATLTRLYAIGLQYNWRNKDIPRTLVRAMGVDPDTFVSNSAGTGMSLSDFRDTYNLLAQQANSLPFVGGIKEFEKSWAMFANYYCEKPIAMGQLYVPVMAKIGIYDETPDPSDPSTAVKTIKYEDFCTPESPISVTSLLNKIKKLLDNLNTSSLMNYVYPDLMNFMVAKGAQSFKFPLLSDMYVLPPTYNELVLTQIHNIVLPGVIHVDDITQDPTNNIIETNLWYTASFSSSTMHHYVDFPFTETPSLGDKIDALMFRPGVRGYIPTSWPTDGYIIPYVSLPDWVPYKLNIFGDDTLLLTLASTCYNVSGETNISKIISKFNYAPLIYYFDSTGDPANRPFSHCIGQLDTWTTVDYQDISALHNQAILGLYTYDADRTLTERSGK